MTIPIIDMSDAEWNATMARLRGHLDRAERHISDVERIMRSAETSRDGFDPAVLDCIADDPRLIADILAPDLPSGEGDVRVAWPSDEEAAS